MNLNELGALDLPGGGQLVVRRSRATVEQDFAVKAPTIHRNVWEAADLVRKGFSEMSATIPVAEIVALMSFLSANTLRVEGRAGVSWGELDASARRDFFDDLGASALTQLYMAYLWLRIRTDRPEVLEQIEAKIRAAVSSEEE